MISFKVCTRGARKDGFAQVYIRVTNNRYVGYIKTDWVVKSTCVGRDGSINDSFVMRGCMDAIAKYVDRLNGVDTSSWGIAKIRNFLCPSVGSCSFSSFARGYINRLVDNGSDNNAQLYMSALRSLEGYVGSSDVAFGDLNRDLLLSWIGSLRRTKRAKTLYPMCVRTIFNEAVITSQEPNSVIEPIRYNPWQRIQIPQSDIPRKRAIEASACRAFFEFEVDGAKRAAYRAQLGQDVALLSFCLAGINTVDIFNLRKDCLRGDVLRYRRAKTSSRRRDGAYFEIRVNSIASGLIDKYRADVSSPYLLCFRDAYCDARSFNASVNDGIQQVCEWMGLDRDDWYSVYTFRHTWATIARNDCGASLSEVGFAMNHLQADGVTRGYIKIDFSPAWALNEKVVDFVFNRGGSKDCVKRMSEGGGFVLSAQDMVYGRAYFRGDLVAEVGDIGFSAVEDVVSRLSAEVSGEVGGGLMMFRIKNVDRGCEVVVQRKV